MTPACSLAGMLARTITAAAVLAMLACTAPDASRIEAQQDDLQHPQWLSRPTVPARVTLEPERADLDLPDTCRRLVAVEGDDGRRRLSKERSAWLSNPQERARRQADLRVLISIVADEMGADDIAAELLWRKAILESSGDPSNVHVLSPDIEAGNRAASKGRKRSTSRWAGALVPVYKRTRKGLEVGGVHDAWALGRGLYGQVTGLHLHRWGDDVPPWSLCDPIVATVTAIWSMRAGLAECRGTTLREAYRRFSSGKCAVRSDDRERAFDRLARGDVRGLRLPAFDRRARADFGNLWSEQSTDRAVLLTRLRTRVAAGMISRDAG